MEENKELINAWDFVEHTNTSIFLTGKAGTGKTTFLRTVKEKSNKRIVVVAPTGVAAINAQGVTIHSFFQLPLTPFVPEMQIKSRFDYSAEKKKIIKTLNLLIIDEISMVRADVLDAIDSVMRRFREHDKPFGGVQLLMIGDLQQLTPVVSPSDEDLLKHYYPTPYFFSSKALAAINYVAIELETVYRQQDEVFIRLLNHVRDGKVTAEDLQLLQSRVNPMFRPEEKSDYILLTTHNRMADSYNENRLNDLKDTAYTFEAKTDGTFPETSFPADARLTLKQNAQVMFIRNDSQGKYYNGKIGHITSIDEETITVQCPEDEEEIEVYPEVWENTKYTLNEKTKQIEPELQGTFTQYPLRLAWAITIHKSQGLTFEHAIIDASHSFASGQVYVALSRCKTLEGMILTSPITSDIVMSNHEVDTYMKEQSAHAREQVGQLESLKQEYFRTLVLELFSFDDLIQAEKGMHRLLSEHLFKENTLITLHQTCVNELQTKVLDVAAKWQGIVGKMTYKELHGAAFMDRIRKGALYFYETVTDIFAVLLVKTKEVQIGNKQVAKRFITAMEELEQGLKARRFLLRDIIDEGFSIPFYLRAKQEAILTSMGQDEKRESRRKKRKEKEPKEPKIPTAQVSYALFTSGKTIEEVAKERGLTVGTITHHLIKYVQAGDLELSQLIPKEKINTIQHIIDKIGPSHGLTAIKALCPADITFDDIRTVLST